jgi:hypothetical protein
MKWLYRVALVRRVIRRWQASAPAGHRVDPVEMGTAYGLEASLAPTEDDDRLERAGSAAAAQSTHGWLRPR